jgi:predicted nucleotidyltransferase
VDALDRLLDHLTTADPGGVLGAWLTGSAVQGGLRPDSDLDVLVVTRRSLTPGERSALVGVCLEVSGRQATGGPARPLELTSLVLGDLVPWRYPPVRDLRYGEWLRRRLATGVFPAREPDPDVAVLVTAARQRARVLVGTTCSALLPAVPPAHLRSAVLDSLDPLLDDLVGDERNVLLTLARMLVTLRTGRVVPKDEAGRTVAPELPERHRETVLLAARAYLGEVDDDWAGRFDVARDTADHLASLVREEGSHPMTGRDSGSR